MKTIFLFLLLLIPSSTPKVEVSIDDIMLYYSLGYVQGSSNELIRSSIIKNGLSDLDVTKIYNDQKVIDSIRFRNAIKRNLFKY
jgi:hypothetical protein